MHVQVLLLNDFPGVNHQVIQLHPRWGFYWAITPTMAANGEHVSVACAVRSFSSMLSSVQFVSALLSLLSLCVCVSVVRNCDACRSTSENSSRRTDKILRGPRSGLIWSRLIDEWRGVQWAMAIMHAIMQVTATDVNVMRRSWVRPDGKVFPSVISCSSGVSGLVCWWAWNPK